MQRLLKTPNAGQLFWYLRRLKKHLAALSAGEMVDGEPEAQATDDVFWLAVFNLSISRRI